MASVNKEKSQDSRKGRGGGERSQYLGIIPKLSKLHIIQEAAGCFNDVFTLLWGLLHFPRQEKATSTRDLLKHTLQKQSHTTGPFKGTGKKE